MGFQADFIEVVTKEFIDARDQADAADMQAYQKISLLSSELEARPVAT